MGINYYYTCSELKIITLRMLVVSDNAIQYSYMINYTKFSKAHLSFFKEYLSILYRHILSKQLVKDFEIIM